MASSDAGVELASPPWGGCSGPGTSTGAASVASCDAGLEMASPPWGGRPRPGTSTGASSTSSSGAGPCDSVAATSNARGAGSLTEPMLRPPWAVSPPWGLDVESPAFQEPALSGHCELKCAPAQSKQSPKVLSFDFSSLEI